MSTRANVFVTDPHTGQNRWIGHIGSDADLSTPHIMGARSAKDFERRVANEKPYTDDDYKESLSGALRGSYYIYRFKDGHVLVRPEGTDRPWMNARQFAAYRDAENERADEHIEQRRIGNAPSDDADSGWAPIAKIAVVATGVVALAVLASRWEASREAAPTTPGGLLGDGSSAPRPYVYRSPFRAHYLRER